MPIAVVCPSCAAKLNAPADAAGHKRKCPKCGTKLIVPKATGGAKEPRGLVATAPSPPPAATAPDRHSQHESGLTRELTEGLAKGLQPREIARNISKRVEGFGGGEGRQRAMATAHTFVMRAYAERHLDAMEEHRLDQIGGAVEWSTARDNALCKLCAPLQGIVLTVAEARGLIPRHEECRCCWTPANVGEDRSGQKHSKKAIDKAIDKSVMAEIPKGDKRSLAEQKERSSWVGANRTIAKKRPKSIFAPKKKIKPTAEEPEGGFKKWLTDKFREIGYVDPEGSAAGYKESEGAYWYDRYKSEFVVTRAGRMRE